MRTSFADEPRDLREEDVFDVDALDRWLSARVEDLGEAPPEVRQFGLGDPLMDLGGALAYWVQADDDEMMRVSKRQPTDLPGMPTRAEVVDRYRARTGLTIENWDFYEVFGLFRLAGIAQQIYYRYFHGQTTNPAFQDFWFFVGYLDERCRRIAGLA